MANLEWCFNVKHGLEIVEPSKNMSDSYLKMAEESLKMIKKNEESRIWKSSTSYYTMYYSLYAVFMKIGIKCEIHQCSLKFMREFMSEFYSLEEIEIINLAFDLRNSLQYYPEKLVDNKKLEIISKEAVNFFIKTKEILIKINENKINDLRREIEKKKDECRKRG